MTDRFTRVVHLEDDMEAALQWCAAREADEALLHVSIVLHNHAAAVLVCITHLFY
jgi:hypothetical protein